MNFRLFARGRKKNERRRIWIERSINLELCCWIRKRPLHHKHPAMHDEPVSIEVWSHDWSSKIASSSTSRYYRVWSFCHRFTALNSARGKRFLFCGALFLPRGTTIEKLKVGSFKKMATSLTNGARCNRTRRAKAHLWLWPFSQDQFCPRLRN